MITQVKRYGVTVWSDEEMDTLRKTRCLCLNCVRLGVCGTASQFYSICKENNIALAVTRCSGFLLKG